ncbi:MAG TPA: VacJ family lipoprotein [Desulfobacteraceae bacterium]|nr:VacJ family lipoprotein [Desulfobacteraceae bacterium]
MARRTLSFILLASAIAVTGIVPRFSPAAANAAEIDFLSDDFYDYDDVSREAGDPLEPLNRVIFRFNDKMYIHVMEPVASVYAAAVPLDLRECIFNFFRNLEEPVRFLNALLQGRFGDSGEVLTRFLINSTLGIYGLGDAATRVFDVPPVEATLGETLAVWGVGDGAYLVVPFYGSSTIRDFTAVVGEGFGEPYYAWTDNYYYMGTVYAGKETNKLSMHLGEYEELKSVLFDPYVSFRNAYFQYRSKVRGQSRSVPDNAE